MRPLIFIAAAAPPPIILSPPNPCCNCNCCCCNLLRVISSYISSGVKPSTPVLPIGSVDDCDCDCWRSPLELDDCFIADLSKVDEPAEPDKPPLDDDDDDNTGL